MTRSVTATRRVTMPVLTVWEPWASAIIKGCLQPATGKSTWKPVENRNWPPDWRGLHRGDDLAIHAAVKTDEEAFAAGPPEQGLEWPPRGEMVLGAVIGVVRVTGWHHPQGKPGSGTWSPECRMAQVCSSWAARDQYHWEVAEPRPLIEPIQCRGYQLIWHLPDDVDAEVRAQLQAATG